MSAHPTGLKVSTRVARVKLSLSVGHDLSLIFVIMVT